MKKLILFFGMVMFLVAGSFAQRTITTDTLQGAETINFAAMQKLSVVTVKCTQTGGTSDGTLTLYGSTDNTNWVFLNFVGATLGVSSPKASITGADLNQVTITNGLLASWTVPEDSPYPYHRLTAVGTSGDSTKLEINWSRYR